MFRGQWLVQFVIMLGLILWLVLDRDRLIDERGMWAWVVAMFTCFGGAGVTGYYALKPRGSEFDAPDLGERGDGR